jgi:hypothetical protein
LPELAFNVSDKPLTMAIDVVLGIKQRPPSSITVGLKRFDVFLGGYKPRPSPLRSM